MKNYKNCDRSTVQHLLFYRKYMNKQTNITTTRLTWLRILFSKNQNYLPLFNILCTFSRKSYTAPYFGSNHSMLNMTPIMLELEKSRGSKPPVKQVLGDLFTAAYKEFFSGWGYFTSHQVKWNVSKLYYT